LRIDWDFTVTQLLVLLLFAFCLFSGLVKPDALPDWITILLTVSLAGYAFQAVREAKRDRRKDLIEKKLGEVYSPLCEILRRARWDEKDAYRAEARRAPAVEGPRLYALSETEFERVREVVERFGHYIDQDVRDKLTEALDDYETHSMSGHGPPTRLPTVTYYRLRNPKVEPLHNHIKNRREELSQELEKLAEKA
jgi:hypothetical protein